METKLLSLVVPVYNVEPFLETCLNSVVNGINPKNRSLFEVILVEDKSSDNSLDVALRFQKQHPMLFKVIVHETNKGVGGARNTGMDASTGRFITFIDADDWYYDGAIDTIISLLPFLSETDVLMFGFCASQNGKILWRHIPQKNERKTGAECLMLFSTDKITSSVWNKVFPSALAKSIGFTPGMYYEDLEFIPKVFNASSSVILWDQPLVTYRLEGTSITRQPTKRKHIEDLCRAIDSLAAAIPNKEVISNIFFDRWQYLLKAWQLWKFDHDLLAFAMDRILRFVRHYRPQPSDREKYNVFRKRLQDLHAAYKSEAIDEVYHRLIAALDIHSEKHPYRPFFSIIIPVFNAERYINRAVEKFARQRFPQFEVIFVNDQSTDQSKAIILDLMQRYDFIKYHELPVSSGAGVARNIGLQHARGTYVMFNDSDDWFDENGLEILKKHIEEKNEPDLVFFPFSVFDENNKFLWGSTKIENLDESVNNGDRLFKELCSSVVNPSPWNKVFKRSIWVEHNIAFPPEIHHQDLATIPYACYKARTVTLLKRRLYNYCTNLLGVTKTATDKHAYSPFRAMETLFNFFEKESDMVFEQWREELIKLAMETFSYNFKLRKDQFSPVQITTYIESFNNFCRKYKLDIVLVLNSKAGYSLVQSLINEKTKLGLTVEISGYTGKDHLEKLFEHYRIINEQYDLLANAKQDLQPAVLKRSFDTATA